MDTLHCPCLENLGPALNEQIRFFNVQNLVSSLIFSFKARPRFFKLGQCRVSRVYLSVVTDPVWQLRLKLHGNVME